MAISWLTGMCLFVLGGIFGAISGAIAAFRHVRMHPTEAENAKRNCLKVLREDYALRHTVMDFVTQMRSKPGPPTRMDWERLVDAAIIEGTPYSIRKMYHRQCKTDEDP